jgi:phage tail-like protein
MDANGLRAFGLSLNTPSQPGGLYAWPLGPDDHRVLSVEPAEGHVLVGARLASSATSLRLDETAVDPAAAPDCVLLRDAFGHCLVWSRNSGKLYSVSARPLSGSPPAPLEIALPAAVKPVFDLAMSTRDIVYVAGNALVLVDTRARFDPVTVALPAGASARRLAADPTGGVYVLDSGAKRLLHVDGQPLSKTGVRTERSGERFSAVDLNPEPVKVREFAQATLPPGETAFDIACSAKRTLLLLSRDEEGARLRVLTDGGRWSEPMPMSQPAKPYSLGWLDDERIVVLTRATVLADDGTPQPERDPGAFVLVLDGNAQQALRARGIAPGVMLVPGGEYYPLRDLVAAPLVRSAAVLIADTSGGARLFYPRRTTIAELPAEPAPLARLSGAKRAPYGVLANTPRRAPGEPLARVRPAPGVIETEDLATVWHRLYVEACVPRNTALIVWLAANDGTPPTFRTAAPGARAHWFPHLIGSRAALPADVAAALAADAPRAAWLDDASEAPQGSSLLGCARSRDETGLFTVLIQRAALTVRTLVGRRLWVTVEMFGDGYASPELIAIRTYAGRVSYRDRHLPALYREQAFGPEGDMPGRATGADFLERFIDLFEGLFTGIEDRVARSYQLTDVFGTPEEALPWLGSWIGLALEPGMPPRRARWMIANASQLARRHGTLEGFKLALDIATDGAVARGRIVVVEDYRLRRTMATILGATLEDHDDPLTAGIARSGNSVVGDTLYLGDEHMKTFLALFRDLQADPKAGNAMQRRQDDEREAARHALYDGLAYRVTVLIHEAATDDEQRLARRLAERYAPAHVKVRVAAARYPFLAAVASLVGADTYLRAHELPGAVAVDGSRLGYLDNLQGLGTLDARGGAFDGGGVP